MYVLNLLRNLPLSFFIEEIEEWFKTKKYPHIGLPVTIKDYNRVKLYVNNPEKIKKHSFLPFIHKPILKRKFRADKKVVSKNPSGKRKRYKDSKSRDTFFASHLDAMIFSKYNSILAQEYQNLIEKQPYDKSIVAYRKIPVSKERNGNKCNIDFAKAAFEYIKNNDDEKLTVIVADITSFFDCLDHKILKKQWRRVLQKCTLPSDHFNVFKALTRIKYVESQQLFEAYENTILVERGLPNSSKRQELVRKRINSTRYFKEKKAVAYCNKDEFLENNLKLIISKNNKTGIPQGSPMSATLANIYMLDFDEKMFTVIDKVQGFYQRYSDDLIIVCEQTHENAIVKHLREIISEVAKLAIEPNKTKLYHFEKNNNVFKGFAIDENTKHPKYNKPLEYLGFSFDGQRVLIKSSGFSKFYRGMKGAFHRSTSYALYSKNPDKSLFKSRLYKRFTYKGAKRKLKYRRSNTNPKVYYPTKEFNWGNYLSYVYKADNSMHSLNRGNVIRKQSRKVWTYFNKLMKHYEKRIT